MAMPAPGAHQGSFVLNLFFLNDSIDDQFEMVQFEWFLQIIKCSQLHRLDGRLARTAGRDEDHRDLPVLLKLA